MTFTVRAAAVTERTKFITAMAVLGRTSRGIAEQHGAFAITMVAA